MPAHGKGANIFANGFDLSPFLSSIDQTQTVDTAEVTTFTAQSKAYIAGQMDSTLSMSGYFDGVASGVDEVLSAALDSDAATVLTVAEGGVGTVGNRALVASGLASGYNITASVSEAVQVSAEFQLDGSGIGNPTQQFLTAATFTRASAATLDGVDYATNAPRYTGGGLLVEEGTTNLILNSDGALATYDYSSQVSNAVTPIANFNNSILFGDNSTLRELSKTATQVLNSAYTFSFYIQMSDGNAPTLIQDFQVFNGNTVLTNGVVSQVSSSVYRISFGITGTGVLTFTGIRKTAVHTTRQFRVTGYQLELKSYPTSYAESGATAFTRAADALSVPRGQWEKNAWAFTMTMRRTAGLQAGLGGNTICLRIILNAGNDEYRLLLGNATQRLQALIVSAGTSYQSSAMDIIQSSQVYKIAFSGNGTTAKIAINGVLAASFSYVEPTGTLPALMTIGARDTTEVVSAIYSAIGTAGRALTDKELIDVSAGRHVDGFTFYNLNGNLAVADSSPLIPSPKVYEDGFAPIYTAELSDASGNVTRAEYQALLPEGTHKLAAAWNREKLSLFVDGVKRNEKTGQFNLSHLSNLTMVGGDYDGKNQWDGTIQRVSVYPRRLDDAVIETITE